MKKDKLFWLYIGVAVLIIIFWGSKEVGAAPAAPITYTATQPDGTSFKARVVGDEWNHRTVTLDGYTILMDKASGYWVYAQNGGGQTLSKSALKVGIDAPEGIAKGLKPAFKSMPGQRVTPAALAPGKAGTPSRLPPVATTGTQPVLVILVEFLDRAFIITNHALWNSSFFGSSSSVADYYNEVSYGLLQLVPAAETYNVPNDGVIAVNLPYSHPGDDSRQITYDALIAADSYVDFSSFDLDSNGYISTDELHVVIVAAGFEEAYGQCSPSVWAHHWNLETGAVVDGVTVGVDDEGGSRYYGGYVQIGELHGAAGDCGSAHMATIGVMAHELGHDLWLPDMYDIADDEIADIGDWGIMAYGSWNSVTSLGDSPAHPTPWDRWYEGWLTPTQVSGSLSASIPQVETSPTIYQLGDNVGGVDWSFYGSSGTGEYFLVENRQQVGYDVGLPGCGILIWHVDETVSPYNDANQNEWGARLVALEQADGEFHLERNIENEGGNYGDAEDPFLAGDNFDASTTPDSNLYDGSPSGASVLVNTSCGSAISVDLAVCDLEIYYHDSDGDGFGNSSDTKQACIGSPPADYISDHSDCNDNDPNVNPSATEMCDGVDNDCNGEIDEGFPTSSFYRDVDADGYGNPAVSVELCAVTSGYVTDNTDCNDTDAGINPGAAEVCDGIDNNCNGVTDEGSPTFTYYRDADGDSFGDPDVTIQACTQPSGYVDNNNDCDDTDNTVYLGAPEICDGLDNDCNLLVDEALTDTDSDGLCDGIDLDDDGDGLPDTWELSNGLDSLDPNDATDDPDGDGFTNMQEYERGWDPQHASTTIYADVKNTSGIEDGSINYPFDTITEAIAAAYDGDTILVASGTYIENINFDGKVLVVMADSEGEDVVINGDGSDSVVTFENGEGPYTELNGFILTNGNNSVGGGIRVLNGSSPLIVNNIITSNIANYGGGIACNSSSPTIINNTITGNEVSAVGGGIYCIDGSSPTVTNTILWNNGDEVYLDGSSITITYSNVDGGYTGTGNINSDPLFADVDGGDYHLQADSPCIDKGTSSDAPADDIDGDLRPQGSADDIGADEYVGSGAGTSGGDETSGSSTGDGGSGGGGGGGCFIATAAFGTPMAKQVRILCEFRDRYLLTNTWGQKFVELYYKYSPPLADYIAEKDGLKLVVRICLIPLLIIALFMLKLGVATKLLVIGGLTGTLITWRLWINRRKQVLSWPSA
jgi:M6 family metalloprotease-like protein